MRSHDPAAEPAFANEDEKAHYYLTVLRDGSDEEKVEARYVLSRVFENRGMLEEATELLENNAKAGVRDRMLYTRLAKLYRQLGRDDDADRAIVDYAMLVPPTTAARLSASAADASGEPRRLPKSVRRLLRLGIYVVAALIVLIAVAAVAASMR